MPNALVIWFKTSKNSFVVVLMPLFNKFLHVSEFCFFQCGLFEDSPEEMLKGVVTSLSHGNHCLSWPFRQEEPSDSKR